MKIAVLTDSGSGMSQDKANELGIFLLPLQIINKDQIYRDCIDVQTPELYKLLKQGDFPKTSMPVLQDIENIMDEMQKQGYDHILSIPLTSGISGTMQAIQMMANEKNMPITTIETYSTCQIQYYCATQAKKLVDQGMTAEQIKENIEDKITRARSILIPNDLDHLKKGGRLTPLAASLASLLKIRPVLKIELSSLGKVDVEAKIRTEKKATQYMMDTLLDNLDPNKTYQVFVLDSDQPDKSKSIMEMINERHLTNIEMSQHSICAVIACHTGLDSVAIQIIEEI